MKMRHDTPKSHTQQRKFKTYPVAMSGVLDPDEVAAFAAHLPSVIVVEGWPALCAAVLSWQSR